MVLHVDHPLAAVFHPDHGNGSCGGHATLTIFQNDVCRVPERNQRDVTFEDIEGMALKVINGEAAPDVVGWWDLKDTGGK